MPSHSTIFRLHNWDHTPSEAKSAINDASDHSEEVERARLRKIHNENVVEDVQFHGRQLSRVHGTQELSGGQLKQPPQLARTLANFSEPPQRSYRASSSKLLNHTRAPSPSGLSLASKRPSRTLDSACAAPMALCVNSSIACSGLSPKFMMERRMPLSLRRSLKSLESQISVGYDTDVLRALTRTGSSLPPEWERRSTTPC